MFSAHPDLGSKLSNLKDLLEDPAFIADLDSSTPASHLARNWRIGETTFKKYRRARRNALMNTTAASSDTGNLTGRADVNTDGGEFIDVETTAPVHDWAEIFTRFNLDPTKYRIVDDTVRMSTWQQSKRLENGDRDTIWLYSYRARFERITGSDIDVDGMIAALRAWKPTRNTSRPLGEEVTYFDGWADWQLGKGEGDGTAGTKQRIIDGFEKSHDRIVALRKQGHNVSSLLIGNMGDHIEAVAGHYTSQTYSVDLNQRDQLNLALELNLLGIKILAPLFEHVTYAACLCNHGQWQRIAGKQFTDDSDNATGFIGDTLNTICNLHPNLGHIDWQIPRDEMITTVTTQSGVRVAMNHGHKQSGDEGSWLAKQTAFLQTTRGFLPELWIDAHKHSAALDDFGPYHRIRCTTQDPGSKSFTDGTGKFASQGTTSFLIGRHDRRKFSHYEVL